MSKAVPETLELVFELQGDMLPSAYVAALWRELADRLPWLEQEAFAGLLPLRGAPSGGHLLLPRRAKLGLRLPIEQEQQARKLIGQTLDIEGYALTIGAAHSRPLQPHPSLHAHLVTGPDEENEFLQQVEQSLQELEIEGKRICGKRTSLQLGEYEITGYSLVVHELKPEASLRLQHAGLGGERRYGCGLFVPCKDIPDFD